MLLLYQIHLVLEDDNVLELHYLDCRQVLASLWLRACLIAGDEEKSSIHDGSTVKHGGHENVVTGAIDERDMANELHTRVTARTFAGRVVFLVRTVRLVTTWPRAGLVFALVDLWARAEEAIAGDMKNMHELTKTRNGPWHWHNQA